MSILTPLKKIKTIAKQRKNHIRQKATLEKLGLNNKDIYYYPEKTIKSNRKYSVVSAVYGVEKYIDDMVASLIRQTLDFKTCIQLILVDDGSVDGSAEKCKTWAHKYPNNIIYLRKENGGQASARNYGIPHATGEWITFIDPDDLVDKDYFLQIDQALNAETTLNNLHLISSNLIFYYEDGHRLLNNHPLKYRYKDGTRRVSFDNNCDDVQLSASVAFFRTSKIAELCIKFEDIRPGAEDMQFVVNYLLSINKNEVLFVPKAIYFYRKRENKSSSLDNIWLHPGQYTDVLEKACLNSLKQAFNTLGYTPKWLQRTILYHLIWHFKFFLGNEKNGAIVPIEVKQRYKELLSDILQRIDIETIYNFTLAGANPQIHLAMAKIRNSKIQLVSQPRAITYDKDNKEVCINYFYTTEKPKVNFLSASQETVRSSSKIRTYKFLDEILIYESINWLYWDGNEQLTIIAKNQDCLETVSHLNKNEIENRFTPRIHPKYKDYLPAKIYRKLSKQYIYKKLYVNAWLFIDRDTQADDNAEHLYRYIKNKHPEVNAWFILRENSHDWKRLNKEGFRMIKFGSLAHKMALLNADHLISSHADHYITNYLPRKLYHDLMQWKFTFLQHGVILNDLSGWLNNKSIHNFITSTLSEYNSICKDINSYRYTSKEVSLTGLPRHDRLLKEEKRECNKNILIMPTWRQKITGDALSAGSKREYNNKFTESVFYLQWLGLLQDHRVKELITEFGCKITFFPHANLQPYLKHFKMKHIDIIGHKDVKSIQDLFLSSDALITDYSSVAFEMALLKKPVLYFQFDEDHILNGQHTSQKGYFDFRQDGFGPVSNTRDELIKNLTDLVLNGFRSNAFYEERMEKTFFHRDGKSCQRVYESIINLKK